VEKAKRTKVKAFIIGFQTLVILLLLLVLYKVQNPYTETPPAQIPKIIDKLPTVDTLDLLGKVYQKEVVVAELRSALILAADSLALLHKKHSYLTKVLRQNKRRLQSDKLQINNLLTLQQEMKIVTPEVVTKTDTVFRERAAYKFAWEDPFTSIGTMYFPDTKSVRHNVQIKQNISVTEFQNKSGELFMQIHSDIPYATFGNGSNFYKVKSIAKTSKHRPSIGVQFGYGFSDGKFGYYAGIGAHLPIITF